MWFEQHSSQVLVLGEGPPPPKKREFLIENNVAVGQNSRFLETGHYLQKDRMLQAASSP